MEKIRMYITLVKRFYFVIYQIVGMLKLAVIIHNLPIEFQTCPCMPYKTSCRIQMLTDLVHLA